MFKRDKNKTLTIEEIEKYIEVFSTHYLPKLQKLDRYYRGKNDAIMNRTFKDASKPNFKIVSPYASYITDNFTSYFVGKPITINSTNEEMLNAFNTIFNYNDSQSNDISIARNMSTYGYGAELLYIDADKQIRFSALDPKQVIPIYSDDIDGELLYCIRFYETKDILSNKVNTYIEVYSRNEIVKYVKADNGVVKISSEEHYFKEVPINIYMNNDLLEGDFEKVIGLINSLDFAMSDTANNIAYFNDAYLLLNGVDGLEPEQIQTMKENRVICLSNVDGTQPGASWLIKNSSDIEMENYKKRLVEEIHKQSRVPDLNGDTMKSHVSAEAVRFSLLQTEQVVAIKEAKFKKALQRKIELICNILNMLGSNYNYRDLMITFNRNIPNSYQAWSDIVAKLRGIVSTQTLLEQLPFVTNIEEEMRRLEEENSINSYELVGAEYGAENE